jgi:tetraacyldisaccharide 4'-kinase
MPTIPPLAAPAAPASSRLEAILTRNWLRRGALARALWPLALVFRLLSAVRARLYAGRWLASTRLPVPVIVVGNIFIGGTGKTPLAIWLVQVLKDAGFRPGVISRGHGSTDPDSDHSARPVTASSSPQQVGDEPLLIAQRSGAPVVVGRDRAAAGRLLLRTHPDVNVVISDDGLQHYALQRDIEIILFDGRGVGNGWLLPAGPLREPRTRRRDFTVVNTPQLSSRLQAAVAGTCGAPVAQMQLAGQFAERLARRGERQPLAGLGGMAGGQLRIVAAAGIGNPGRFFAMLRAAGLTFSELALPDHHDFRDRPFAACDADMILITEKDAVKCVQIEDLKDDPRLWVVPVTAHIDAALAEQIVEKIRGCSPA